jgi:outer membrane receptor for ferrienterochelin and colicins
MKTLILVCFVMITSHSSFAQLQGVIYGISSSRTQFLQGAKVTLLHGKQVVYTDEEGKFELILPKELPDTLVFSANNYINDTLIVDKKDRFLALQISLFEANTMEEVVISFKKESHSILRMKALHIENIGEGELRKAACCNLSESFETNASVDVNITDAVSGAKKIQMLGIDGVYTQIQMENIPYLRGLESSFGLNAIPGTWIKSIQITKGTGTVVNGYESMAGLVNLEFKKPHDTEKIFVNAYTSAFGRAELNLNGGFQLNEKWSTAWFAHGSGMFGNIDNNKDGFRDVPMGNNLAFSNRYMYQGEKFESQLGITAYQDNKYGGQNEFDPLKDNGSYGVVIQSQHIDAFAKTGFIFKNPEQSLGIIYNLKYQDVEAKFGNRAFKGIEKRAYINGIYDTHLGESELHKLKIGASAVYIDMQQAIDSTSNDRVEIVPGAFSEYTYSTNRFSSVLGARVDYHNLFGLQFSPRYHAKYDLTEFTTIRLTAGKGWRVPNYMIDNISLLANSHVWKLEESIRPEIAWNFGGSLVQEFKLFKHKSNIVFDFFRTEFVNQLIVDRDKELNTIVFSNMIGKSFSNSFQVEWFIEPVRNLEFRFAYKLLDVQSNYAGKMQQQVMIPKHRGFANVSYKTRNKKWEFNTTYSVFGQSRLPQVGLPDGTTTNDIVSEIYPILNAQITYVYKKWDFYLGGENLTNYTQNNPIIDAQNPFSSSFSATRIWGPIMGRNIYAGIRFAIKQPKHH